MHTHFERNQARSKAITHEKKSTSMTSGEWPKNHKGINCQGQKCANNEATTYNPEVRTPKYKKATRMRLARTSYNENLPYIVCLILVFQEGLFVILDML